MEVIIPLPEYLTCRLNIKNGVPYASCRDKVPPTPAFVFRVDDGYRVLHAKVEVHFESKLPGQWCAEFEIYLKPSNNAPQKDYQILCQDSDALRAQLERTWHKARLRRNGHAGFELLLFVYVPKSAEQLTTLRRASAARIHEQMPRVATLLREQGIAAGRAAQTYMAVTQTRLPEGAPLVVPDNTTFHQLQHVDAQQAAMEQAMEAVQQEACAEYYLVRVKIQDVPVPLQVNISDLRAALGLPSYSLRPPFRAPASVNTPAPANDIEDIDHADAPDL